MKVVKRNALVDKHDYLVYTGYNFSPSGFDIAKFEDGVLTSQTNGQDLFQDEDDVKEIYELPVPKNV